MTTLLHLFCVVNHQGEKDKHSMGIALMECFIFGYGYKHEEKTNTKSIETNFSLMIRELVEEARDGLLGIMTEDVHCPNDITVLTVLVADWKNIDEC